MSFKKSLLFCSLLSVLLNPLSVPAFAAVPGRGAVQTKAVAPTKRVVNTRKVNSPRIYRPRSVGKGPFQEVQKYLQSRNYSGLKTAASRGLDLNAKNADGDTSVCVAVKQDDYNSFHVLKSLKADLAPSCIREIPESQKQHFINTYLSKGGVLSPATQEAMMAGPINWPLIAGVGVGVAVVGGGAIAAIAASGGGSSKSSGGSNADIPGFDPDTSPDNPPSSDPTNPEYYRTREFLGTNFQNTDGFLGQIRADYAYATMVKNNLPVAGEGIVVGLIDDGLDVNHRDLANNILKDASGNVIGANFNHGPCRGSDRTNCWAYESDGGFIRFYDEEGVTLKSYYGLSESKWKEYETLFPADWDWDAHKNDPSPVDYSDSHGTHVAGIMAATKDGYGMHGVAYNAKILGVQRSFFLKPYNTYLEDLFKFAVDNGAQVINNSWGSVEKYMTYDVSENEGNVDSYFKKAIKYTADHGVVSLFSAGNDYNYRLPNIENAAPMALPNLLYYKDGDTLKPFTSYPTDESKIASSLFVTVVSVNSDNELAFYSQKCGSAAKWCIAAPGGEFITEGVGGIGSTVPGGKYDRMQGTSMATPVVTGALAAIMGAAPSLKPEEAVAIMFETATNIGSEDLFGRGLLNLGAALSPVGTTSLALGNTTTGNAVGFAGSRVTVPARFANSILEKLPSDLLILDKYKRGFAVPVESVIRPVGHSKQALADNLKSFTRYKKPVQVALSDKVSMRFSQNSSAFASNNLNGMGFDVGFNQNDLLNVSFSFTQNAKEGMENYFDQSLRNPFTSSASDVYALKNVMKLTDRLDFAVSAAVGKNNFFDGNERLDYRDESGVQNGTVALTYKAFENTNMTFSGGLLNEKGSVLGLNGSGAFDVPDSQTYFMGVEVSSNPIKNLRLSAAYYYGTSKVGGNQSALMRLTNVESESLALNAQYALSKDTTLGLKGASPLYVRKASAAFDLPTARNATEDIVYRERMTVNLKSEAREWDMAVFGSHKVGDWTFQAEAMARFNPDHQADVKNDYRLMFSVGFGY